MANLTATTGNWTAAAGTNTSFATTATTAADEITIPTGVTVTVVAANTVVCRSLTVANGGTLVFAATTSIISMGDATAGTGNVALSIGSTATITLTGIGGITFVSSSATQQTITTNGKTLPNVTFNGAGSSYLNSDAMTTAQGITLTQGTWNPGNFTMTATAYASTGSLARTFTPGSSAFTLSSTGTPWNVAGSNLTWTANTATVTVSGSGPIVTNTNMNTNGLSLVFTGGGNPTFNTPGTWANVTYTGPANKTSVMSMNGNLTCSTAFISNGNSLTNRVMIQSATVGTAATITAASVTLTNTDFMDITAAGAASPFTGTSLGDAQGNTNITTTTPVNRYAVVAGNGSSTATWSVTSGGSGGASVPLVHDNVFFDASSAAGTYAMDMPRISKDMDCTGFTRTLTVASGTGWWGSVTLASGMTFTASGTQTLYGRGTQTITSAGKAFNSLTVINPGGTYTQQDAITLNGSFQHNNGTWTTQSFSFTCLNFYDTLSSGLRTFNGGTTTVTITNTGASNVLTLATAGGFTWNGTTMTFVISVVSANTRTIALGGLQIGTLTYTVAGSTGQLTIQGGGYIDTLNFSDVTNARTLAITSGTQLTVKSFNVNGTTGKLMTVNAVTAASPAYLELVGPVNTNDYLSVQDIYATFGNKFYAGANSTSVSGNTNVTLTAPPSQLYIYRQAEISASSNSLVNTFPFNQTAVAGSMLVLVYSATANPGTVTTPSGYTLIDSSISATSAYTYTYYKLAAGGETSVTVATTNTVTGVSKLYEVGGFTGTATFDVASKNNTAGATSLSTDSGGTGPTNTANPAMAIAVWQANNTLGATVSFSNSFIEQRESTQQSTTRWATKPLSSNAAVITTNTWTTSRVAASQLVVFKDVASGVTTAGNFLMFM